jgi:hypothetical protein
MVLQTIGKFKSSYLLSDSSDDEHSNKTGGSPVPENRENRKTPENPENAALKEISEIKVDESKDPWRYQQSLSDEDDSSDDGFPAPIMSRVTFRPTVIPQQLRLLEKNKEHQGQGASPDHRPDDRGRDAGADQPKDDQAQPEEDDDTASVEAMDVDDESASIRSSSSSTSSSTKQRNRTIATVDELKKHFIASVERTFK